MLYLASSIAILIASPDANQAASNWTSPRTSDGHPDLQGYWTNATLIPLERPTALGAKEFYTEEEASAADKQRINILSAARAKEGNAKAAK